MAREQTEAERTLLRRLQAEHIGQKALMEALEISSGMASMMLSGKRGIPPWHLDGLAKLLNTTVSDLFTDRDPTCQVEQLQSSYQPDTRVGGGVPVRTPSGVVDAQPVAGPSLRRSDLPLQPPASGATADVIEFLLDISKRAGELVIDIRRRNAGEQAPATDHLEPKPRPGYRAARGSHPKKRSG